MVADRTAELQRDAVLPARFLQGVALLAASLRGAVPPVQCPLDAALPVRMGRPEPAGEAARRDEVPSVPVPLVALQLALPREAERWLAAVQLQVYLMLVLRAGSEPPALCRRADEPPVRLAQWLRAARRLGVPPPEPRVQQQPAVRRRRA